MITNVIPFSTELDNAIERLLESMKNVEPTSSDYAKTIDHLTKLYKMREIEYTARLKDTDLNLRQKEGETTAHLKKEELDIRRLDVSNRALETDGNFSLKDRELKDRRDESETSHKLKEVENDLKRQELDLRRRVSMDTVAVVAANIAGILVLVGYERVNVMTSKAMSFVMKLR